MRKVSGIVILLLIVGSLHSIPLALADDDGVAGCSSVKVDPAFSLDAQQTICNTAEGNPATSCSSADGTCSSPKLNDTLPDADHCICVGEAPETVSTETEVS